ncbi:MAG: hypothetical protein ACI4B3_12230 [Prevotella sp.]
MKKILMAIVALMTFTASANAMSYEQARREALFLTDKMAYELNLTDDQYDAAYEINLDYLMGVTSIDDVYGMYWTRRNTDLCYILHEWQWELFRAATYFYRPLYWNAGCWHFGIYARYPHRNFFYFSRPTVYVSYRGGHSWHSNGGRSYYMGQQNHFRRTVDNGGMRDRWDRGEIGHNSRTDRGLSNGRNDRGISNVRNDRGLNNSRTDRNNGSGSYRFGRSNGNDRSSSTRVTVRQQNENRSRQQQGSVNGERMQFNRNSMSSGSRNSMSSGSRNSISSGSKSSMSSGSRNSMSSGSRNSFSSGSRNSISSGSKSSMSNGSRNSFSSGSKSSKSGGSRNSSGNSRTSHSHNR